MLMRRQPDLTVVMDNVNKPHNLSAIIRSCDAVGIHRLFAVSSRRNVSARQGVAAGASRWTTLELQKNLGETFSALKREGHQLLVATNAPGCVDFRCIDYTRPTAIVMGAELDGVSEEAVLGADHLIAIPMQGMVESLNVSVAAAVILFEAQRQRAAGGMYDSPRIPAQTFSTRLFELCYPRLAEQLNQQGLPYPELDEEGSIVVEEQ